MSDNETVFVTSRGECYHTSPDCLALNGARTVVEKSPAVLADDVPCCRLCSTEYTPSSPFDSMKRRKLLEECDPDEIF